MYKISGKLTYTHPGTLSKLQRVCLEKQFFILQLSRNQNKTRLDRRAHQAIIIIKVSPLFFPGEECNALHIQWKISSRLRLKKCNKNNFLFISICIAEKKIYGTSQITEFEDMRMLIQ